MRTLGRCLLLVLPILAGCKGQLAGVTVNLAADGSGECAVFGIRDLGYVEGESAKGSLGLQNVSEVRSMELRIQQSCARFANIEDLKVADISFAVEKRAGESILTVRIPASPAAKWFETFGVSEQSLQLWNRIEDESKKAESRTKTARQANGIPFEQSKPPNVLFELNLPGKLAGQAFETVPLGLTTKVSTDHGERQATLSIPLTEIHAKRLNEIVWKIRYAME
jgi:hypothetical protein